MKKTFRALLILVLMLSVLISAGATAENNTIILNASQGMIEGTDYSASIDTFIEALELLEGLTLKTGSRGNYVAAFQSLLIHSGYLAEGESDGIWGKKTTSAVREFQKITGLPPTGEGTVATQFMLVLSNADFAVNEDGIHIAQIDNFAVVIWPDYSFYIGLLESDGDLDYGTYYFTSGDYYAGDFKDDYRHGTGTAYYSNGDIYIGDWANDVMSGKGIYYFGGMTSVEFYDGEWANDMMNGNGTYVTSSGEVITGTWQNNQHKEW